MFVDAVRQNGITAGATHNEVENCIKTWLRNAPDRKGGRLARMKDKANTRSFRTRIDDSRHIRSTPSRRSKRSYSKSRRTNGDRGRPASSRGSEGELRRSNSYNSSRSRSRPASRNGSELGRSRSTSRRTNGDRGRPASRRGSERELRRSNSHNSNRSRPASRGWSELGRSRSTSRDSRHTSGNHSRPGSERERSLSTFASV